MPRHAQKISCNPEDQKKLHAWSHSRSAELRQVERSKIILACLEGKSNFEIASELGISLPTVVKWRTRFAQKGIDGLADALRSGKPKTYGHDFRNKVLSLLEKKPPKGLARWDSSAIAQELDSSVHAVWRVLQKEGIYLNRLRTWCVSTDPEFATKAATIVGLYLDPPENAIILCVDEKPSIQALERASGYVITRDSKLVRALKSTYKRHGTLNLFAALDVATGHIHARTTAAKKREDFQTFLDSVLADLPQEPEVHVILDNYSTHKKNEKWLEKYRGRVHFHFTPTSASWLNQVEIWFGILTRKTLRGTSFKGKEELRSSIEAFIERHNNNAEPFKWRKREVRGSQLRNKLMNFCN